jgi:transcriptional regulator with XRE-family HTH domain
MNPKVFVSHAREDKERFVLDFARRLRDRGIDAWVDQWEILPGDSLVDKLFDEGLRDADAVIIVLSQHSVHKPWVREELNAALVNRINRQSKLIPVLIDKVSVPEALRSTVWEEIRNLQDYEGELRRIVMAIYGMTDKPTLGMPPAYVATALDALPGLTRLDTMVLQTACEVAVESGHNFLPFEQLVDRLRTRDIAPADVIESLEILDGRGSVQLGRVVGGISHLLVSVRGFEEYAQAYIPEYERVVDAVGFAIVNDGLRDLSDIAAAVGQPSMLVEHVLDRFKGRALIDLAKFIGGNAVVTRVHPELRRVLSAKATGPGNGVGSGNKLDGLSDVPVEGTREPGMRPTEARDIARRLRVSLRLSEEDLARMLATSGETIRRWEQDTAPVSPELSGKLLAADAALAVLLESFVPARLPEIIRRPALLFDGERALDWILGGRIGEVSERYDRLLMYQG